MFRSLCLNIRSVFDGTRNQRAKIRVNICTPQDSDLPYQRRLSLLTAGEHAFYEPLCRAVGRRYGISLKTRLADVVACSEEHWKTGHGNRIGQKHIDFLLYDLRTAAVVLAIELDDKSHATDRRRERDAFVDEALRTAGVVLLRVEAAASYSAAEIDECLRSALQAKKWRGMQ